MKNEHKIRFLLGNPESNNFVYRSTDQEMLNNPALCKKYEKAQRVCYDIYPKNIQEIME